MLHLLCLISKNLNIWQVMESLEHAMKRGAPIIAEYLGGAVNCDAYHMTDPRSDGLGVSSCIQNCLQNAGVSPEEVIALLLQSACLFLSSLCILWLCCLVPDTNVNLNPVLKYKVWWGNPYGINVCVCISLRSSSLILHTHISHLGYVKDNLSHAYLSGSLSK